MKVVLALALLLAAPISAQGQPAIGDVGQTAVKSVGCKIFDDYTRYIHLLKEGDDDALIKFLDQKIDAQSCALLEMGHQVILERTHDFDKALCVRPRGEPYCYWVHERSITRWSTTHKSTHR